MAMTMNMSQADSDSAEPGDGEQDDGYSIEIYVYPDGTFAVSSESADVEAAEKSAVPHDEAGERKYKSLRDALRAVTDLYNQMSSGSTAESEAEANFKSGLGDE